MTSGVSSEPDTYEVTPIFSLSIPGELRRVGVTSTAPGTSPPVTL